MIVLCIQQLEEAIHPRLTDLFMSFAGEPWDMGWGYTHTSHMCCQLCIITDHKPALIMVILHA